MKPVFAHIILTDNLGDLNCCPQQYFPEFADCARIDVSHVDDLKPGIPVIVGGGGLFMSHTHHHFGRWAKVRPVIVWGAGLNYPKGVLFESELVKNLRSCALVGVRNGDLACKHGFEYVPDVSCMHSAFDRVENENRGWKVLFYEHQHAPFAPLKAPWKENNGAKSLDDVLAKFRASEYVVTNSFHGAYWGLLMQRRVLLWKPEQAGNRFDALTLATNWVYSVEEILKKIDDEVSRTSAIFQNVCRTKNRKFCLRVKECLGWGF